MSEPTKCNGCGQETKSDTGWCLSCRSILYTDLLIAESDFSKSPFQTMVFPVRDIIWMQDRIRLREAELKAADDTNDMISAELARLRAALASAERERDEALLNLSKQTEYAEILAEKAHNMEVQRDEALIDRKHLSAMLEMELKRGIRKERKLRKTIRALVVAGRGMSRRIVRDHLAKCPWEVYYKSDRNFVRDQIKQSIKDDRRRWFENKRQLEEAERGQAGKE